MHSIVIDVESNGLFGGLIAVGAVIVTEEGKRIGQFGGYVRSWPDYEEVITPWVDENVMRHCRKQSEECPPWLRMDPYDTTRTLRNTFVEWLRQHMRGAALWVDCGFPVETTFLGKIRQALTNEGEDFVIVHEAATLLLCVSEHQTPRHVFSRVEEDLQRTYQHNPIWDAWVSWLCIQRAAGMINGHMDRMAEMVDPVGRAEP